MYRKKSLVTGIAAFSILSASVPVSAAGAAPESIQFEKSACVLPAIGESYDTKADLSILGDGASENMVYSIFDESVAEVSEDGTVTAKGYGVTTMIASSAADETVSASMDVTVFDLYGTYSGTKTIEAMGCDVTVDITLNEDGTYTYYRAPMAVQLGDGEEMPELEDKGTYQIDGMEITFQGEDLEEFTITFCVEAENGCLEGKIPTGGAPTEIKLVKAPAAEEGTEAAGEAEDMEEEKNADTQNAEEGAKK